MKIVCVKLGLRMNIIIKLIYFEQTCLVHVIKKVANPEIKSKAFNPEKNIKNKTMKTKEFISVQ